VAVASGATLAFNRSDDYGGNFTRAVTGAGGLRLDAGLLSLSGANTYAGSTAVNGGVLAWLSPVAQPASGTSTVADGAVLSLGVGSGLYSVADFESLHAGSLANVSLGATSLAGVDTSAGDVAIASTLGGTRGVAKTGAGTLTLSGSSSYTGSTVIRGGTLAVATLANGGVASPLGGSSADAVLLPGTVVPIDVESQVLLELGAAKIKKALVGQQFVDRGFVSTSISRSVAESFAVNTDFRPDPDEVGNEAYCTALYRFQGSAKAFALNDILWAKSSEQEILIQDGRSFEVTDAVWSEPRNRYEKRYLVITLKALPE
jgi:autotransporter-associated beta strand protein